MALPSEKELEINPQVAASNTSLCVEDKKEDAVTISVASPKDSPSLVSLEPGSAQEPLPKKSISFKLTILFLCIIMTAGAMDAVIVSACLSAIAADLNGSSTEIFWVGTSFLLAQTATILPYSTFSHIFGRKYLLLTATAIFIVASILCATAQNVGWLIGARVFQGVGAGGTLNLISVIISDITTMRERGKYLAFAGLSWAIGTNIGVPLGGVFAEFSTWRWVFWINLPLCIPPFVGLIYTLNLRRESSSFAEKLARIDYLGMAMFCGATCAFLIGITTGGTINPWSSAQVIAPIVVGVVLWIAFVIIEWKYAKEPMIHLRIFNDRTAASSLLSVFIHGLVIWTYSYYMIIFFLGALQHGRFRSALETLPGTAYTAPAAIVAGLLAKKLLRFRMIVWVGWVLLVSGLAVTIFMKPDSNGGILYGIRVLSSVGGGLLFPTPIFGVQINQKPEDVGKATSLMVFFRSLGQAFGVALGGVIFQNQWDVEILKRVVDGSIPKEYAIGGNAAEIAYSIIEGYPEQVQLAYRWVYADSLNMVWISITCISAIGLLGSLASRNESLDKGNNAAQTFEERPKKQHEAVV